MANVYQTPPASIAAPREEVSLLAINNYIYFVTSNCVTHNLFSNGGFCSLLQSDRATDFVNNIFASGGSGHNSNEPHIP